MLGGVWLWGVQMGRADSDMRSGLEAREGEREFCCPVCAYEPQQVIVILDTTQRDRAVRLFKCECGELIWDD